MAIITLLTDFGPFSHRVAKLKGNLLSAAETVTLVDLSHNNALMDLREPAFLLRSSYESFPKNTIHLCNLAQPIDKNSCLIAKKNGQYFVCFDNGFLSLSIGKENVIIYRYSRENLNSSPPDILTEATLKLTSSLFNTETFATEIQNPIERSFEKPVESGNVLRITTQYIDFYGNIYTNLSEEQFLKFTKDHKFSIRISREYKLNKICTNYSDVRPGEMLALFGEEKVLQLSINQGSFSHLMAIVLGQMFIIEQL